MEYRLKYQNVNIVINEDNRIGSGGQGTIYTIPEKPDYVVKIYNPEKIPNKIQYQKLVYMVKNPLKNESDGKDHISIAWPIEIVLDRSSQCVGYVMPEIKDIDQLIEIYNPKKRRNKAPKLNWAQLHTIAANICSIVELIHSKEHIIGDIKPENFLVNSSGQISVVDVDSFQIYNSDNKSVYPCDVFTEEYAAPEFTQYQERSKQQDLFGLAIIIYQLLFGQHPYRTLKPKENSNEHYNINVSIATGYANSSNRSPSELKPSTIPMEIVDIKIQNLFERAFEIGNTNPFARPSAKMWKNILIQSANELLECQNYYGHQYTKNYGKCYWCESISKLKEDIHFKQAGEYKGSIKTENNISIPTKNFDSDKILIKTDLKSYPYLNKIFWGITICGFIIFGYYFVKHITINLPTQNLPSQTK